MEDRYEFEIRFEGLFYFSTSFPGDFPSSAAFFLADLQKRYPESEGFEVIAKRGGFVSYELYSLHGSDDHGKVCGH